MPSRTQVLARLDDEQATWLRAKSEETGAPQTEILRRALWIGMRMARIAWWVELPPGGWNAQRPSWESVAWELHAFVVAELDPDPAPLSAYMSDPELAAFVKRNQGG